MSRSRSEPGARPLVADGPAGPVPTVVLTPEDAPRPWPLVLFGHGAHLSKDDEVMGLIARAFTRVPAAVALIDCPGHGARRPAGQSDEEFDATVRRHMADPATHAQLVGEWKAVADAVRRAVPGVGGSSAYVGFSMGSIFGLSIAASLEVRAAVFALGGLVAEDRPGAGEINRMIRDGAARLGGCDVLMLNMTVDESFPIAGAIEVLTTIPGPRRMGVWVGGHNDIPPEAVSMAVRHLRHAFSQ